MAKTKLTRIEKDQYRIFEERVWKVLTHSPIVMDEKVTSLRIRKDWFKVTRVTKHLPDIVLLVQGKGERKDSILNFVYDELKQEFEEVSISNHGLEVCDINLKPI